MKRMAFWKSRGIHSLKAEIDEQITEEKEPPAKLHFTNMSVTEGRVKAFVCSCGSPLQHL